MLTVERIEVIQLLGGPLLLGWRPSLRTLHRVPVLGDTTVLQVWATPHLLLKSRCLAQFQCEVNENKTQKKLTHDPVTLPSLLSRPFVSRMWMLASVVSLSLYHLAMLHLFYFWTPNFNTHPPKRLKQWLKIQVSSYC